MVTDDREARDLMGHDSRARLAEICGTCDESSRSNLYRRKQGASNPQQTAQTRRSTAHAEMESGPTSMARTRHAKRVCTCSVTLVDSRDRGTDAHAAVQGVSSTCHREAAMECHGSIESVKNKLICSSTSVVFGSATPQGDRPTRNSDR